MRIALDLDGTILDAERRHVALAQDAALRLGLEQPDAAHFWKLKRDGYTTEAALTELGASPDLARDVSALWAAEIEDDGWLALDEPLPGALAAITELAARGTGVFVLTARRDRMALRRQLQAVALPLDVSDIEVVDPLNAVAEKAVVLEARGAQYFIGDTESDAAAAEIAAVPFVGVSGGMRTRDGLVAAGVDCVVEDLHSALRVIGALP